MPTLPHRPGAAFLAAALLALLTAAGCDGQEPAPPLFAPGEYGGDPLPGTEEFWNVRVSPDGEQVSLVRVRTPDPQSFDPLYQLWVTDRNGTNPELISVFTSGADWSPDGTRLAVTRVRGIYVHTIDLAARTAEQWTGLPHQRLSEGTAGNPKWFADGRRLLVDVAQRSYQMPYPRGAYVIDTETGETTGPILELFENTSLGDGEQFIIGQKFVEELDHPRQGNAIRYDRTTEEWEWITDFSHAKDDFHYRVRDAEANPAYDVVVQPRSVENAWQLFLMDSHGENVRQITTLGGDNPRWSYDGRRIYFRRDVHRGPGARYVPYVYDLDTETAAPLWPALPDSLPAFPPLDTQAPISLTDNP